jgi:primosomal protein N'
MPSCSALLTQNSQLCQHARELSDQLSYSYEIKVSMCSNTPLVNTQTDPVIVGFRNCVASDEAIRSSLHPSPLRQRIITLTNNRLHQNAIFDEITT